MKTSGGYGRPPAEPAEPGSGAARARALQQQSEALLESDIAQAQRLAHESARLAAIAGDKLAQARGLRLQAVCAVFSGHPLQALAFVRDALPLFRKLGDAPGEAACLLTFGGIYAQMLMSGRAIPYFEKCIALCVERGIVKEQLFARNNLAHTLLALGRYDESLALLEENIALARRHRMPAVEQFAVYRRGVIRWIEKKLPAAGADARIALRLAAKLKNEMRAAECERLLGAIALDGGRLAEAEKRLHKALAGGLKLDSPILIVYAQTDLAHAAIKRGDLRRARERLKTADRRAGAAADPHLSAMVEEGWGRLALAEGNFAAARERAQASLRLARELGYRDQINQSRKLLGEIRTATGAVPRRPGFRE